MTAKKLDENLFKQILSEGYARGKSITKNFDNHSNTAIFIIREIEKRFRDYMEHGISDKISQSKKAIKIIEDSLVWDKEDGDPLEHVFRHFKEEFFPRDK